MSAFTRLEVTTNLTCNAVCEHCNRAIGLAKFRDGDLTEEQSERAVKRMKEQGLKLRLVTLGGTEPILNPELPGIMRQFAKIETLKVGRLLTNDIPGIRTEEHPEGKAEAKRRSLEPLPKPFQWQRAPLEDPEDPKSGKRKHIPFFWSPTDLGIGDQAHFSNCTVKSWCGRGFDAFGWSMCGVAGVLGRLLRIDPYTREGASSKETPGICKHCPYALPRRVNVAVSKTIAGQGMSDDEKHDKGISLSRTEREAMPEHLREAEQLPKITETFQKGFDLHRAEPMDLERY